MTSVSIIVCTVRAATLPDTVRSLLLQDFEDWELVVADQSQGREIGDYLSSVGDTRIRHLPLRSRGLSRARNAGIAAADSGLLVFTDDDCEAPPGWLSDIHALFADDETDLLFGPVIPPADYDPSRDFCPSDLIPAKLPWTWDVLKHDMGNGIGANMSLRKTVVDKIGLFDPMLGAGSDNLPSGEETDYAIRALAHDVRVMRAPIAPILHKYGTRPGSEGKRLEMVGNFCVGAVHQKQMMAPYGSKASPHLKQLYRFLCGQVIINLLRGRRRSLGINRLRALFAGRTYAKRNLAVKSDLMLTLRSPDSALYSRNDRV